MIHVAITQAYVEALDGRDTDGWSITIQIGRLLFDWSITWGRK